jgi:hypothetical protein
MISQPETKDIVTIKRYYTTLKRKPSYRKKVSFLEIDGHNKVVVEYLGTFPKTQVSTVTQRNMMVNMCKRARPKQRTSKLRSKQEKSHGRFMRVYYLIIPSMPPETSSKLFKMQNIMVRSLNEMRHTQKETYIADEMQALASEIHSHPLLQEMVHIKGKPPCLILYNKEQMADFH